MKTIRSLINVAADCYRAAEDYQRTNQMLDEEFGTHDRERAFEPVLANFERIVNTLRAIALDEDLTPELRKCATQAAVVSGDIETIQRMTKVRAALEQGERMVGVVRVTGYDAAKAGKSWKDNPYERSQPEYEEWERGWCSASNLDRRTWRPMKEIFAAERAASRS